jgi:hypothetical protein
MSIIPAILALLIVTVENSTGDPNEKLVALIVPDVALRVFLSKNLLGWLPTTLYIVISVGSVELDTLKSIGS